MADEKAPAAAAPEAGDAPISAETEKAIQNLTDYYQNPELLAKLQGQYKFGVAPVSIVKSLPKPVQRRVKALKKLQSAMVDVEAKFYEEVHELECKYAAQYQPLYDRRKDVVTGDIEPTDEDCEWPSDEEDEEGLAEGVEKVNINGGDENEAGKAGPGVPGFWLTIFKNVDMLAEMVQEHDEPILEHLTDIQITFKQTDPMSFTLHFHFAKNDFFSNTVLTKEYVMRAEPDAEDPLSYEGPEIVKCTGCKIDWQTGKNVTVKLIKKVQKHHARGQKRTITKSVQNDSFFNFFAPPEEDEDEETQELLAADYEIGHFFRERVIPRAILYYTGEALEDEDDFDDDEDEEGDDDEEEEGDDEE